MLLLRLPSAVSAPLRLSAVSQGLASEPVVAVLVSLLPLDLVRAIYPVIFKRLSAEKHAPKSVLCSTCPQSPALKRGELFHPGPGLCRLPGNG